jgi:excinuclease ABC subunit C
MYAGIPGRRCTHLIGSGAVAATFAPAQARMRHSGAVINRPPASTIPDTPGSYQFVDSAGRVLYVGKAKSLRSRLSNYFADPATLPARTAQMVALADHVEWIQVSSDVEAMMLEYSLIKRHRPRFNIRLVDDKSYPWLAITMGDEWPRAAVVRGKRRPGNRYFGPYAHAGAIRGTLDLLLRSFPIRTCSDNKLNRHVRLGRPCLLYHIEKCSGPCIKAVEPDTYRQMLADLMAFLSGDTDPVVKRIETEMRDAATSLDFERAARLRDRLAAVRLAIERQQVVSLTPENLDVIGLVDDELEAAVCVFHVRRGRVVGRRAFIVDKVEDLEGPRLVGRVLEQVYGDSFPLEGETAVLASSPRAKRSDPSDHEGWASGASDPFKWGLEGTEEPGVPRRVLVPQLPDEPATYEAFLAACRGGPVALAVPMRGGRKALLDTVTRNASEELVRHRLRRAQDHNSRARALEALQRALGLEQAPLRIECFDMSHLQGTDYVGSMVVLEDGLPRPSEYRRFKVRDVPGNDDYAAMHEVLTRRFTALLQAREEMSEVDPEEGKKPRKFSYPPQLLLLDGGKGQLGVGVRVLENLGLADEIPVAALAKSFEEVFRPASSEPVRIPRGSDALFLLQRVRDEAHRFAIGYHRKLRGKRMTRSVLEGVTGLGPARRARLLREFGSTAAVRRASLEELIALSWLPEETARALYRRLHDPLGPRPGRTPLPVPAARSRALPQALSQAPEEPPETHDSPSAGGATGSERATEAAR